MAPTQTRKRKSTEMEEPNTPTGSPAIKKMRITQSQKQALIDNLQLEITERARHLRAHYALQCADLRARIERRINRVPTSMRTMTMGELLAKYDTTSKPEVNKATQRSPVRPNESRPLPAVPNKTTSTVYQQQIQAFPQPPKARKRKSSEIHIVSDKENEPDMTVHQAVTNQDTLPVQKNKRTKTTATGTRTASRSKKGVQTGAGGILSPRSHNSRTLPRSPIKDDKALPQSPTKQSYIARPVSPLKSVANAATSALSAAAYGLAKRGAAAGARLANTRDQQGQMLPPPRPHGNANAMSPVQPRTTSANSTRSVSATSVSDQSTTSTSTVIKQKRGAKPTSKTASSVRKTVASPVKATSPKIKPAKKTVASKAASAVKRGVSKKEKPAAEAPVAASTGRVLRKRN